MYNTYWNHKGLYQRFVPQLNALVPVEGSVDKPRSTNRALEKFRKASNCYADLYNNGLCNRAQEFRQVFGFASSHFKRSTYFPRAGSFKHMLYDKVEQAMDEIVLAAAKEQGMFEEEAQAALGHA